MYTLLFLVTVGNSGVRFGIMVTLIRSENTSSLNFSQNSTSNTYNLFNFVQTVIQGVHILEYCVLMWSLVQFHRRIVKRDDLETEEISSVSERLKREIKSLTQCHSITIFLSHCLKNLNLKHILLIIFLVLIYPAIILVTLVLYTLSTRQGDHEKQQSLYLGTLFVDYISTGVVRIIMIIVTVLIEGIWYAACVELEGYDSFEDVLKKYDNTGELISPLQHIFKKWFVLQWIVYFIEITQFCMLFFDEQVINIDEEPYLKLNKSGGFHFSVLLFHITTFAIPYFCGISMNFYHKAYLQASQVQQKKILSQSPTDSVFWLMQNTKLVPKNAKYQFVPSLGGLTIPLNSTGHNLTIAMAILIFWLSLVSKWVSKDT